MIKILRISNRFNLGGPTFNVAYLTRYMPDNYQTKLVGGVKDESEASSEFILENQGVTPIIIEEMKREIDFKMDRLAYKKIKEIIREFQPHIVHTHASKSGAIGRLAAWKMGVPLIFHTFHGHVFHSYFGSIKTLFYKMVERFLASKSTKIIAISNKQKIELSEIHKICSKDKIVVIPLGFDLNRFSEKIDEKRIDFRKTYHLHKEDFAIGIVGRLVPIKNHNLFLQNIAYLKANSEKKIKAFIIGDGELKQDLMQRCQDLGLSHSTDNKTDSDVVFTSWIKNVDWAYAGMDLISLVSFNEGTPVSLIEAQASGTPIISSKVGGVEDIVMEGENALLFDSDDLKTYNQITLSLLNDNNRLKSMGKKGIKNAFDRFGYQRLVDDMDQLYRKELALIEKN